jgi:hypothetical protein
MAKLHPLPQKNNDEVLELGADNPTVFCESCGITGKTHTMYGFLISMGVTGHPYVPGFCCGASQGENAHNHWSCANEQCFIDVLVACAREHKHDVIQQKIKELP